jgi:hypothetical protein
VYRAAQYGARARGHAERLTLTRSRQCMNILKMTDVDLRGKRVLDPR